jgi:ATP-dependent DNA ligase
VHRIACDLTIIRSGMAQSSTAWPGQHGVEGIVSKRINGRYEPDWRTWLKVKCLNREEFVVVGWSDPEGSRHRIGALLLGYYTPEGKLIYAGRAETGLPGAELERLWQRLQSLGDRQDAVG